MRRGPGVAPLAGSEPGPTVSRLAATVRGRSHGLRRHAGLPRQDDVHLRPIGLESLLLPRAQRTELLTRGLRLGGPHDLLLARERLRLLPGLEAELQQLGTLLPEESADRVLH